LKDDANDETKNENDTQEETDDTPQAAETAGKTSHDSNAQQCAKSENAAGQNDNKDEGVSCCWIGRMLNDFA
jgi:hypothetical protein